jgi:hypothetical protein
MGFSVGIMADAGHLPGDLQTWGAPCDLEAVVLDLLGDVDGGEDANGAKGVVYV